MGPTAYSYKRWLSTVQDKGHTEERQAELAEEYCKRNGLTLDTAAKAEGKYTGRAPTAQAKAAQVLKLHGKGLTKEEIAKACEIGIASVYRILKASSVSRLATKISN